ncbi:hypothetical protein [Mycobacterium interjectum]|nr:hypothetical protein [Mycobacterium interjectum]
MVFIGALLWSDPSDVLDLVHDDDITDPQAAVVLSVIRRLHHAGKPVSPQLVLDELIRTGARRSTFKAVADAVASGACPESSREYAAAVVAKALRRRVESGGTALRSASRSATEAELAPLAAQVAATVTDTAHRLARLRGEER